MNSHNVNSGSSYPELSSIPLSSDNVPDFIKGEIIITENQNKRYLSGNSKLYEYYGECYDTYTWSTITGSDATFYAGSVSLNFSRSNVFICFYDPNPISYQLPISVITNNPNIQYIGTGNLISNTYNIILSTGNENYGEFFVICDTDSVPQNGTKLISVSKTDPFPRSGIYSILIANSSYSNSANNTIQNWNSVACTLHRIELYYYLFIRQFVPFF